MRRIVVAVAIASIHCSSPPATEPPRTPAVRARRSPMQEARAYELGDHLPRDYQAAAQIYRTACNDGQGDLEVCGALIRAALHSRGTELDRLTEMTLTAKICVARHEPFACVMADLLSPSEAAMSPEVMAAVKEALATPPPCDATHVNGCWAAMVAGSLGRSDGSSAEARREEQRQQVCAAGILEGCIELVHYARDKDAQAVARRQVTAACSAGDADACEAIDRRIDPKTLCAANDYEACALLGCAGDEAAAELADVHQVDVRCDNHRVPDPVTTAITPAARPPFDSIDFHLLGTLRRDHPPHYEVYNASTRTVTLVLGAVYAYDAAGSQLARTAFELRHLSLAPGAGTTLVVSGRGGDSLEPCVDVIEFADERDHVHVARCPDHKPKGARWGDGRDTVELRVSLSGIPLADDWTGTLEPMLAEPFEQSHPGIRVHAISGDYAAVYLAPATFTTAELGKFTAAHGATIETPLVREPTSIAFQVRGIDDLQVSATTLARIFAHQIVRWNDPAIARDNPQLVLPSTAIVVIQDQGGTDEHRLTGYLASAARGVWKLGTSNDVAFFQGVQRVDPRDLVKAIMATDGTIAYLGPGLAEAARLRTARLAAHGAFVTPTSSDYPIVSVRSLYIPSALPDQATADATRAYATWLLTDAQAIFDKLGYGRVPESVTRAALTRLGAITVTKPN